MYNTRNDVVGAKTTTTARLAMNHALFARIVPYLHLEGGPECR